MDHPRAALFMQVIDVLGHDDDLTRIVLLQLGQRLVRGVRRYLCCLLAAAIIKIDDQLGVTGKAFGGGDVLDAVLRP